MDLPLETGATVVVELTSTLGFAEKKGTIPIYIYHQVKYETKRCINIHSQTCLLIRKCRIKDLAKEPFCISKQTIAFSLLNLPHANKNQLGAIYSIIYI